MSSMFDFDDSHQLAFQAKTAGKALIAAKYDVLKNTGDFLFNAHSDGEFAQRCEMIDDQLSNVAYNKLATLSDSKTKLAKALHTEWALRHAKCKFCKTAEYDKDKDEDNVDRNKYIKSPDHNNPYKIEEDEICKSCGMIGIHNCPGEKIPKDFDNSPPKSRPYDVEKNIRWDEDRNASRKFAKSVCEMCGDGELDPDSAICRSCGHQSPSPYGKGHVKVIDVENRPIDWEEKKWASTKNKKKAKKLANKYIEKRGDQWVILQKGTGKVLSHHDSKEKAEASFRAMMQSKHGSLNCRNCGIDVGDRSGMGQNDGLCENCLPKCNQAGCNNPVFDYEQSSNNPVMICHIHRASAKKTASFTTLVTTAHLADNDYCPNCDGEGCAQCGHCPNCGNEVDAYGDHYGMIGCPADDEDRYMAGGASNVWPHAELGQHEHGDCPFCSGSDCPVCQQLDPGADYFPTDDGHDMGDVARHDMGHDQWHAMYGDSPCTSEEDCAAKRAKYDEIDNMRDKGEPVRETDLHDKLHEQWHRDHGDEPCTSVADCRAKSVRYKNSSKGDSATCSECGGPVNHKDVRGYLELCDRCYKGDADDANYR
jgi:hypothetical protein